MVKYVKRKPKVYRKKRTIKKRDSITKIVKRELSLNLEPKEWRYSGSIKQLTAYADTTFQTENYFPLGPNFVNALVQGTGNSNRIGNSIRVKKVTMNYILYPYEYDNTGNVQNTIPQPYDVRFMVLHSKTTPASVTVSSSFFDANNGTNSPADNLQDMLRRVNKDIYVVSRDTRHKVGYADYEGTASNPAQQNNANNDYKLNIMRNMDITSAFPTNIVWNDTVGTPTSFQPYGVFLIAPANGTVTPTGTLSVVEAPLRLYYEINLTYTDA